MKILIEAMHGMGDLVCMLPMIQEIKTKYSNADLTILINKNYIADVLMCSNIKFKYIKVIDAHGKKVDALLQCLNLRKEKFDLAIASANTPVKKSKLIMNVIHAKKTIGIQYSAGKYFEMLNDSYHFVNCHYMALDQLDLKRHNYAPVLYANIKDVENIKRLYGEFTGITIGVCVGRGDISYTDKMRKHYVYTRGWGDLEQHIDNMTALIKKIIDMGWDVVMFGGKQEEDIAIRILDKITPHDNIINTAGKTTIAESIALASLCKVMVGVDTGMQHVSDAVGITTVSIFGPTNPKTHGAYSERAHFVQCKQPCQYCYGTKKYTDCSDRKCLSLIKADDVFKEIKEAVCGRE